MAKKLTARVQTIGRNLLSRGLFGAPMSFSVRNDDGVAIITLENGDRMNSFDPEFLQSLRTEVTRLLDDGSVGAIVLTGSGKGFSVGADVGGFHQANQEGATSDFILAATENLHPMLWDLHGSHKPFVAAVNGVAAGGGLGLALAADARVGSPAARFAAGYFGIGASPDGGSTWFLPRLIGFARTKRFFMDNEVMDAETAHGLGLLDEIVAPEALLETAVALARRWSQWAPHSIESTKRLLEGSLQNDLVTHLDLERGLIAAAGGTADFREGVSAFVEKRKPKFSRRGQ